MGFIVSAKSAENLTLDILEKNNSYFLTYEVSKDYLKLFFTCIRGKNYFNNDPSVHALNGY